MTAKAVINSLVRRHGEGGRLFAVKGAQAKEVAAPAGEGDILPHHVLNGIAGGELVEKRGGKRHEKTSFPAWDPIFSSERARRPG